MVEYANYLISIFMNINENLRNDRTKIKEKNKECTYKITNISPAICSSVSNMVSNQCLDILLYLKVTFEKYLTLIFTNFNQNSRNHKKAIKIKVVNLFQTWF